MDTTTIMLSLLFGTVGLGFLMYGKNAGRVVPMAAGLALTVCPYFISSVLALLVVCTALVAVPFFLRGV